MELVSYVALVLFVGFSGFFVEQYKVMPAIIVRITWAFSKALCHNHYDTGHPFIMDISENRYIHTYCRAFGSGSSTTLLIT